MTPKQETVVMMYEAGKSCLDIAREMGICFQAVARLLERAGHKARPKANPDKWNKRREELQFLSERMTQSQIAEHYGVSQTMIHKAMKRLGIQVSRHVLKGETHPNFKDGRGSRVYRTVITKDKCRKCGTTENLGIHHKNDDHYDNRLENLEVLCNSCHMSETKRKWWAAKKAGLPTPKSNAPLGWKRKSIA